MIGKRIGKWTILEDAGHDRWNKKIYSCKCDCGNIRNVLRSNLLRGGSLQCRTCAYPPPAIEGKTYGQWTIMGEVERHTDGHRMFLCRCSCGTYSSVGSHQLKTLKSTRCTTCTNRDDQGRLKPRTK